MSMNNTPVTKQPINKYINYLLMLIMLFPPIMYLKTTYKYSINLPFWDDYDCILKFMLEFKKASGIDKIILLFRQEAEHRTFLFKLVQALHYFVYGNINFRHFALCCVLFLLIIFIVSICFIRKCLPDNWVIPSVLLSFSIFDLNNYENAIFSSAGLFNHGVIMLFLLSLFFYMSKNNKLIPLAALFQISCIYSGGNGMIAAFFILVCMLFNKEKLRMMTSIGVLLVFCPLYFYHYTFSHANSGFSTTDPAKVLPFFLNALGGNFGGQFAFLGGLILFIALLNIILANWNLYKNDYVLLSIIAFMITSLGVMSVFRGNLPLNWAFAPRYTIYSHIALALLFVFMFKKIHNNWLLIGSVPFFILIYAHNYANGKAGFEAIYTTQKTSDYAYPPEGKEHAKQLTDDCCKEGIYCIEDHRKD